MSGKKRPILTVLVILGVTALFLGTVMIIVLTWSGSSSNLSFGQKIAVIKIEGTIRDSGQVLQQLINFKKDKRVKAIILRINSPGGGVSPSQEIYREVRRTIRTKKVIASLGGLAASGGYYIASAANKIVASPGTITGSIGVIMEFIQVQDLLKKIGVGLEVLKVGEFKDTGSPHRKMSEKERELMKRMMTDIQNQFINAVARGRNLPVEKVKEIADGRVFSGARARELGLVDMLGNFRDAIELAKKMSGIKGDVTLVYPKRDRAGLWGLILEDATRVFSRAILNNLRTHPEYRWDGLSYLYD